MTAAEQIRALMDECQIAYFQAADAQDPYLMNYYGGKFASHSKALAIVEAEDAKRAEAIKAVMETLRSAPCPRPYNCRPDNFETSACFDAGECGCAYGEALNLARAAGLTEDKG